MASETSIPGWRIFLDRGGTFTDIVAEGPDGRRHVRKVLSDDARHGEDAVVHAMRQVVGEENLSECVRTVRMGTTVATNALLERKLEPTCLAITRGFGDALAIGFQDRAELFELEIRKPEPLAHAIIEVDERVLADGTVRRRPDEEAVLRSLERARAAGCSSLAIVLVHGFVFPEHEETVARLGRRAGFRHVSVSSDLVPELGLVARGDTTLVDACLSPILRRHVAALREDLGGQAELRFMQSDGGLADAEDFSGKDAILSGPAGGVVALARLAESLGLDQAIGLDMGGTSTDVSRWSRSEGLERHFERKIAGVRLRAPMLDIVTVAAGGGSILDHDGRKFSVGPESAGAAPGPACYRAGGPGTVTDANVVLGRLQPEWFPSCLGPDGDQPLDASASRARLTELAKGSGLDVEQAAAGFLRIANENMAQAIHQLSVARGHDVREHALVCFGGAGAQHACALAASLGIRRVILHPLAGVFSALGMGLADATRSVVEPILEVLSERVLARLSTRLAERGRDEQQALGEGESRAEFSLDLRYEGVEHALSIPVDLEALDEESVREAFSKRHARLFGFDQPEHPIEVVALRVLAVARLDRAVADEWESHSGTPVALAAREVWFETVEDGHASLSRSSVPVYARADLRAGQSVLGPALIVEEVATTVIEPHWHCEVDGHGNLILLHGAATSVEQTPSERDPVRLAIFGGLFMSIAEQMGETLRRVSHSTNIKERLDYSCALFTPDGRLVANAPHVPVHLGAMGETVRAILEARGEAGLAPGQVVVSNDPYHGGSHLPDVTVVSPVHLDGELSFFVANRGHHADVGGVLPGSMPPFATSIDEEGVRLHDVTLVEDGRFLEDEISELLLAGPHPVRDVQERLSDLRAQVAANAVGVRLLTTLSGRHGADVLRAYMGHVIDDAAEATRDLIARLPRGAHHLADSLDDGSAVAVTVTVGEDEVTCDFEGTADQLPGNLNAPKAITTAAVLFVVRSLIGRTIPLNAGCLEPITIRIPPGCLLDPQPPAAVAGGNVETSMRVADVLLGAIGALAAGQGTMNNVTFGDGDSAYYETICGGAGAGPDFDGASAVHVHLTNTRITDVEVLERRHAVLLREFSVRVGSGGAGRHAGGDGVRRVIEFLREHDCAVLSERRDVAPFGLDGGEPGAKGRNRLLRTDGREEELGGKAQCHVMPGDVLVIETPGGGGYGAAQ